MDSRSKHFELRLHFIRDQVEQHQAHFFTYQADTKLLIFLPNLYVLLSLLNLDINLRWNVIPPQV